MAEYIERDKALKAFITKDIRDMINAIPAAHVQPVKRGRWLHFHDDGIIFCSECEREAYWDSDGQQLFDYCPYCGADMRGEDNG